MHVEVVAFLVLGVCLSGLSKLLQFAPRRQAPPWLGNALVVPATLCLTLALLFALPPFRHRYESAQLRPRAWSLASLGCGAVMSFY